MGFTNYIKEAQDVDSLSEQHLRPYYHETDCPDGRAYTASTATISGTALFTTTSTPLRRV